MVLFLMVLSWGLNVGGPPKRLHPPSPAENLGVEFGSGPLLADACCWLLLAVLLVACCTACSLLAAALLVATAAAARLLLLVLLLPFCVAAAAAALLVCCCCCWLLAPAQNLPTSTFHPPPSPQVDTLHCALFGGSELLYIDIDIDINI